MQKLNHNYTCDKCHKPATHSIQDLWHSYEIDSEGDFIDINYWEGSINEFYCQKHWQEQELEGLK